MERKLLGQGVEHLVYLSRDPEWVLKKPRLNNLINFRIFYDNPGEAVLNEINFTRQKCLEARVGVPITRVFNFEKGYIIAQKTVVDDGSMSEDEKFSTLLAIPNHYLLKNFLIEPRNFAGKGGKLFMTDLTMGLIHLPQKYMSFERQNDIRAEVMSLVHSLGLKSPF